MMKLLDGRLWSPEERENLNMKQTLKRGMLVAALISTASFVVACGGGKEEESEPSGPSMGSISKKIESPTGTVDATTAGEVAMAFEESMGVPTGGNREEAVNAQSQELPGVCDSGTITVDADSSGAGSFAYNNCCIATCCIDGSGTVLYDTSGSGTYSICADYDISESCDGLSIDVEFSYCVNSSGEMVYAIEVAGDTFAVTGSMSNGTGSLTITGENGTFTCNYTDYTGSCTDSSGGSFSF
jgi:hypothetical protein